MVSWKVNGSPYIPDLKGRGFTALLDNIIKCLRGMPVLDTFLVHSLLLRANVPDKKRYTLAGLANELAVFTETATHGRRPWRDTAVVNRASKLSLPSGRPS
ncbi:TPA: hypothetical protein ACTYSP_004171 [Citrobacter freundii]